MNLTYEQSKERNQIIVAMEKRGFETDILPVALRIASCDPICCEDLEALVQYLQDRIRLWEPTLDDQFETFDNAVKEACKAAVEIGLKELKRSSVLLGERKPEDG